MSIIKITNAHKYYNKGKNNEIHVMDNINLELPEKGMVAIFGRSGCGKTTLLNAIGGLDNIGSGSIELFGSNLRRDTDTLRNKYVGYIFQNYNLNLTETVYENVAAALRLCGMTDEDIIYERTIAALSNVEMDNYKNRTPDTLSGGQQQRVAIARALVKNPAIILADEPTGNLDENNTVMVMDILKEISKTQLVLLVTHEANLVDFYCDKVIEIVDGRIESVKENSGASGYTQRNKNDIYLGELEKTTASVPGVSLEYYGEHAENISLRIVNVGGKLYLKSDTPSLRIIDETSEIKLVEGVFEEKAHEKESTAKIDMSRLAPFEGKKFGRLYHFGNSLRAAFTDNFSKKQKKGKRLLRVCMFMLSFVLVFMSATAGVPIKEYFNIREMHNPNIFYLPLTQGGDYSAIYESIGENGIDYAKIIGNSPFYSTDYIRFRVGNFVTASSISIGAEGDVMDVRLAKDLPLLCGTMDLKGFGDLVITSALADDLIEASSYSYINSYETLLGLISSEKYADEYYLRIVGVVESDEKCFYLGSLPAAWFVLNNQVSAPFTASTLEGRSDTEIANGSVIYRYNYSAGDPLYKKGDSVKIFGRTFTVSEQIKNYTDPGLIYEYVRDVYGEELLNSDAYIAKRIAEDATLDKTALYYEWLFDYNYKYVTEFYKVMIEDRSPYEYIEYYEWAIAYHGAMTEYLSKNSMYAPSDYAAYLYFEKNGKYPSPAELEEYVADRKLDDEFTLAYSEDQNRYWMEYSAFVNNRDYYGNSYDNYFIMSDEDYISLSYSAGASDEKLGVYAFGIYEFSDGSINYDNHMLIHASDPEAAGAYLSDNFGADLVVPDEVFDEYIMEYRVQIIAGAISICVVLLLMCLCIFFIMRSNFMGRVREVGIMRAIGVSKKNLTFRFMIETMLLTSLTTLPGYIISAFLIGSLQDAPLFGSAFFFPVWMSLILIIVIYLASLIFGLLPVALLLRKTPSEILAKYDI